jgi:hypothetical protein
MKRRGTTIQCRRQLWLRVGSSSSEGTPRCSNHTGREGPTRGAQLRRQGEYTFLVRTAEEQNGEEAVYSNFKTESA